MNSDDKKLRVHGVPQPRGMGFLDEVKVDAARNAVENLRRQAEQREFEEAKARGLTPSEIIAKGKEDLRKADPVYAEEFGSEDEGFDQEDESKPEEKSEQVKEQDAKPKQSQAKSTQSQKKEA